MTLADEHEVQAVYRHRFEENANVIYQLASGHIIVKRSEAQVRKFDVAKWEEISFIPDQYEKVEREITTAEAEAIQRYLRRRDKDDRSLWEKIKAFFPGGRKD